MRAAIEKLQLPLDGSGGHLPRLALPRDDQSLPLGKRLDLQAIHLVADHRTIELPGKMSWLTIHEIGFFIGTIGLIHMPQYLRLSQAD